LASAGGGNGRPVVLLLARGRKIGPSLLTRLVCDKGEPRRDPVSRIAERDRSAGTHTAAGSERRSPGPGKSEAGLVRMPSIRRSPARSGTAIPVPGRAPVRQYGRSAASRMAQEPSASCAATLSARRCADAMLLVSPSRLGGRPVAAASEKSSNLGYLLVDLMPPRRETLKGRRSGCRLLVAVSW
jgi:hypothetical protein